VTTISKDNQVVTLINVFTVEPEDQQRLVELLVEATEQTMRQVPGYVSANIHRGLDGRHVANYAQWRSPQDFRAMLDNPEAGVHMDAIRKLATNEGYLYEVVYTDAPESH
jgi:antibiotic biosynthesis monooxygenase (ABM) superfamily enzyme